MNEEEIRPEAPADAEEAESAKRLAQALETKGWADQDPEIMAVVRLFQVLASPEETGEFKRRMLRTQLVTAAPKPRRRLWLGLAAAAAVIAAALLAAYVGQLAGRPSRRLLAEREQMARKAFSSVVGWESTGAWGEQRLARTYEHQWQTRTISNLENARYARLTGGTPAGSTGASSSIRTSGGDS
jgi:hypothetical protein